MNSTTSALSWILAWTVFIILLGLLAKTPLGGKIVYYVLWLAIAFLIVTHYKDITNLLQPITGLSSQATSGLASAQGA